jgi:hypothetical protein
MDYSNRMGRRKKVMGKTTSRAWIMSLKTCVFLTLILVAGTAGQENRIVIKVVDGRNGKLLSNQRLLVFAGESSSAVRQHKAQFQLVTDENGTAFLPITSRDVQWIQVWLDWHVLCQDAPNNNSFSVKEIMRTGLSTPNTCGGSMEKPTPGHFIVFARPAHWWEKMRY